MNTIEPRLQWVSELKLRWQIMTKLAAEFPPIRTTFWPLPDVGIILAKLSTLSSTSFSILYFGLQPFQNTSDPPNNTSITINWHFECNSCNKNLFQSSIIENSTFSLSLSCISNIFSASSSLTTSSDTSFLRKASWQFWSWQKCDKSAEKSMSLGCLFPTPSFFAFFGEL